MNGHAENEEFARLIDALNPWLGVAVIIGGWAHRLYRIHPVAQVIAYAPIGTLDTDVAIPAGLRVEGDDLRKRLLANGFEEERLGQDKPPATHYRLRDAETGFYAEFLTPLIGAHEGRDGQPKATKRIAGVVSQQLRYLEVLLDDPWTVEIGQHNGFPVASSKQIRIANPVGFLAHKLLIHSKRTRQKFAKDILYIHDTLALRIHFCGVVSGPWPDLDIEASLLFKLRSNTAKRSVCGVGRSFTSCPISSTKSALGS